MKYRFTRPICGLLLASLLLPGCATIISTPHQTIRVAGQPAGSTIYVNDEAVKTKPVAGRPDAVGVRLSRKKNAEIKVKLDGYKEYTTILQPNKSNPVWLANYGIFLGSIPFWFSQKDNSFQSGGRTYSSKTTELNLAAMLVGLGSTLVGPFIDIGTGANRRFGTSEIHPQLVRLPKAAAGAPSIQAGAVGVSLKGGDKMGNHYVNKEVSETLYFGKSLNLEADNLRQAVNASLQELGYPVPSAAGRSVFSSGVSSRFTVQADMRELRYDVHQFTSMNPRAAGPAYGGVRLVPVDSRFETTCNVEITWKLLNQARQTVAEVKTNGHSTKQDEGSAAFEDAFENSLYAFLEQPDVAAALAAKGSPAGLPTQPAAPAPPTAAVAASAATEQMKPITMHRPPVAKPVGDNGLAAAARYVVTVETATGHGSGCLLSADGYLVTNAHVVDDVATVKVQLADGIETTGQVVRVNPDMDLALVKIDVDGLGGFVLPTAGVAELGADVFAIGTPADKELGQSITKGIVSGRRKIEGHSFLQTDVSINSGNSGGALVTRSGQLVGIVNAKLVGRGIEGIGFAIPAEQVAEALQLKFID